jgi:thiosulfate/3-mercaptopyruvate sulfurtransferase
MAEHLLVTTGWLADHLGDANLRIIDIRGHVLPPTEPLPHYHNHHEDYLKSHIPGAAFVDWVHEITDPADPRHARIAPPARFAEAMQRAGVDDDSFVVAYDDAQNLFSARLWWALNYHGHDQVAVLDGGWPKWVSEGRPVTSEITPPPPATFTPRPQAEWIRTAEDVASCDDGTVLLDLRSPAEFIGQASRAKRAGHIPGALNWPRNTLNAPDGTLLPADELRERLAELGLNDDEQPVITYCNAGVSASMGLLALRVAGFHNSANYDGSWKDWGNDERRPIE